MAIFRYPNWRWPEIPGALEDFERARRQMDRLLSVFTGGASTPTSSGVFPPLLLTEDENTIYVEAEIPGIKAEDLDISVVGRTLTLSGERKAEETQDVNYHRRERKWGSFRKALTLPGGRKCGRCAGRMQKRRAETRSAQARARETSQDNHQE